MSDWLSHCFCFLSLHHSNIIYLSLQTKDSMWRIKWGNSCKHIRRRSFFIFCSRHCAKHFTYILPNWVLKITPYRRGENQQSQKSLFNHIAKAKGKFRTQFFVCLFFNSKMYILSWSKQDWLALLLPHTYPFQPFWEGYSEESQITRWKPSSMG